MGGFLEWRQFAGLKDLGQRLESLAQELKFEAVKGLDCFSPSPERFIMDENDVRLFVLPVRWQGRRVDQVALDPSDYRTFKPSVSPAEMIRATPLLTGLSYHPLIVNAMYSMSMPGCEIIPHIDRDEAIGEVYRMHVGLSCPEGDCALIVDGERREWRDGEVFMFDSARVEHSAHNRTRFCRLIAIIDVDRRALQESEPM